MSEKKLREEITLAHKRIAELEARLSSGSAPSINTTQELIFENAPGGIAFISLDGDIIVCNREAAELLGYSPVELTGLNTELFYANLDDKKRLRELLERGYTAKGYELPLIKKDGTTMWASLNVKPMDYSDKPSALISFMDITDLKRANRDLALNKTRFQTLYDLSEMIDEPDEKILEFALEAGVAVTDSDIGYIYFLNDDETELSLHAWSKHVMPQCSLEGYPKAYKVAETGLWGEAIRQRKPIITNDYDKSPHKRGYPEGHVPVKRHMNIPLFDKDKIVLLAGVGNKETDYTKEDVSQLQLLMSGMWRIIERKRAEKALKEAHLDLEHKIRLRTVNLEEANENLAVLNIKLVKRDRERDLTQKALEESESRFRALFENNHAVMLLIDPESGQVVDANPAAALYYGYTHNQLLSKFISEINILTPEQIKAEMANANKEKRSHFFFRHRLADKTVRDVEVFSGPVKVAGQNLLYSIVHDITDRKLAEETLQRYKRVIDSTPDLVSLVDRDYFYRMVNDSYLDTFGKEREEIVDKSLRELLGDDFFEKYSRPNLDRAFSGETVKIDTTIDTPAKGTIHLSVTYNPVQGLEGNIDYVSIDARDITDLKQSEEALKVYSERLELATDAGTIGIWEWDISTNELIWDKMMMLLYKVDPATFKAHHSEWQSRVHPEDLPRVEEELARALEGGAPFESEFRIIWPDGDIRNIRAAALIGYDDEGNAKRMTGVNFDVTRERTLEEDLRRLATTDPLTGASNRRHFMDRAAEEFDRGRRYHTPVTLLSLDIDHFKKINDTYGHMVGDEVLKALVITCKETLRTTDIFARMGGEEFSAVLPQTDIDAGIRTGERLRKAVKSLCLPSEDGDVCYTISIGLSEVSENDLSIEDTMRRADEALYKAKETGRDRVESK